MNNRNRSKGVRRLLASRRANSAAEFALILPLLLTLVIGTLQVGAMMYSYNLMVGAARDAARTMAVCSVIDATVAKNNIYPNLPPWVAKSSWVITTVFTDPVSVTISVDVTKAAILSYIPFNIGTLNTFVQMKKEPLAFGGGSCT